MKSVYQFLSFMVSGFCALRSLLTFHGWKWTFSCFLLKLFVLILYVLVCGSCRVRPEAGVKVPLPCFCRASVVYLVSCPSPFELSLLPGRFGVRVALSFWTLFSYVIHTYLHASAMLSQLLYVYSKS